MLFRCDYTGTSIMLYEMNKKRAEYLGQANIQSDQFEFIRNLEEKFSVKEKSRYGKLGTGDA